MLITRVRSDEAAQTGGTAEPSLRERARALLIAAFGPLITIYAAVAAVFALVSTIAPHARFSAIGTLLAAGPGLLAVYQVPVEIAGAPLGVLPLLPTIGACVLVARTAGGAALRLGYREPGQAVTVIGVIAGSHALVGALIALASNGEPFGAGPLAAMLIPGVLAGGSALVGLSGRCGITVALRRHLNPVAMRGLRAGVVALAALLAAGCVIFAIGLLFSLATMRELFVAGAPGIGGGFGMLLLSVSYLPNAVVAGAGFATGPGFSMGALSVSPFGFTPGPVPGVPLLAGIPESYAGWWPLVMALPLACGLLVGFALRDVAERATARLRAVAIAGTLAAFGVVLLATLAGGKLGAGSVSPVEIPAGLFSLAAFGWIVLPAGVVAWFAGPHPPLRLRRASDAADTVAEDDETEDGVAEDDGEDDEESEAEEDGAAQDEAGGEETEHTEGEDAAEDELNLDEEHESGEPPK